MTFIGRKATRPARPPQADALASSVWSKAQADARAFSSNVDRVRLFAGSLALADAAVIVLASAVAFLLRYGLAPVAAEISDATLLAVLLMINIRQLDGGHSAELTCSLATQLTKAARCWGVTIVLLLLLGYATRTSDVFSRLWAGAWCGFALIGFALVRLAAVQRLSSWRRRGRLARLVAIVDLAGTGPELARRLRRDAAEEMRLVGVFSAIPRTPNQKTVEDLVALSKLFRIDEVLVTVSGPEDRSVQQVIRRLATIPTTVRLCPVLPQLSVTPVQQAGLLLGSPTLTVCLRPLGGWHIVLKRMEDIVLASLLLPVLAGPMLLIAIAVRLDSSGPVLFRQKRLGFNNNTIIVYKFRSMTHQPAPDESHVVQAQRVDPRVTRVGRVLRRTSLDELPQLFNVLRGEMSLVGPRPHAIAHNTLYAGLIDDYLGRHRVQPGITGWAQVNGLRGETDTLDKMQRRVEFDLAYIERWSVLLDLRIIAMTAFGSLFHRNAY